MTPYNWGRAEPLRGAACHASLLPPPSPRQPPSRRPAPGAEFAPENFPWRLALSMLGGGRGRAGPGSGSSGDSLGPPLWGRGLLPAMGSPAEPGRVTWVLAGAILAAALALPAGPGGRGWPPAGPRPLLGSLGAQPLGDPPGAGPQRPAQVRRPAAGLRWDPVAGLRPRRLRGGPSDPGIDWKARDQSRCLGAPPCRPLAVGALPGLGSRPRGGPGLGPSPAARVACRLQPKGPVT